MSILTKDNEDSYSMGGQSLKLPKLVKDSDRKWSTSVQPGGATLNPKDRYMPINSLKWNPNSFVPDIIFKTSPLNDRSTTPRSAAKAIALERTFDRDLWIPNKYNCDLLNGYNIYQDK